MVKCFNMSFRSATSPARSKTGAMATALQGNEMSIGFETRALDSSAAFSRKTISCTVVTGFLGSGKTTLVKHIMESKGVLRVALLVNEFSPVDIDSLLLRSKHTNVAVGAPAGHGDLSGGCACCVTSSALQAALRSLLSASACDHLLLETSGLADPAHLAPLLQRHGVQLDRVVAVVDADNVDAVLQVPLALRQLAAADVVLLNKCDLLPLAAVSDAEDQLLAGLSRSPLQAERQPSASCSPAAAGDHCSGATDSHGDARPSHGHCGDSGCSASCAPPATPCLPPLAPEAAAPLPPPPVVRSRFARVPLDLILNTAPPPPPPALTSATGDLPGGFLSHEARLDLRVTQASVPVLKDEPRVLRGRVGGQAADAGRHSDSGVESVVFSTSTALSAPLFQQWVAAQTHPPDAQSSLFSTLLRAKGFVFFREFPSLRFVFQVSGRGQASCLLEGAWASDPECRVVLIGRSAGAMQRALAELSAMAVPDTSRLPHPVGASIGEDLAQNLRGQLIKDGRFEVRPLENGQEGTPASTVLEFGLKGLPLKGISDEALNAIFVRRLLRNKQVPVFLFTSEESAVARTQRGPLMLAVTGGTVAEALGELLSTTTASALAESTRGLALCRCDISAGKS